MKRDVVFLGSKRFQLEKIVESDFRLNDTKMAHHKGLKLAI